MNAHSISYKPNWFYLLILLVIAIVAYWPVSFHVFSLKNDALNYFLPVRTIVTESYANFSLPLWTPYINLGYPIHSDMQAGVWNPFVQLLSLTGPYTLRTLQLETVGYIFISGTGMFFVLKHFALHPYASLLGAVSFMLSGFNSDSCQFIYWIGGNAFLPFVFLFYYRLLHYQNTRDAIGASISLYLMLVCGSPADFILTLYLLLALFLSKVLRRSENGLSWRSLLRLHALFILLFVLLILPAALSFLNGLPVMARGSGVSLQESLSNSLFPPLLTGWVTPLANWQMPGASVTDPLERNSYIGLAGFILMLTAFLIKIPQPAFRFSKWAMLVFLVFSLGAYAGLRAITFEFLPLMNTFRHPANAKMFTIFFGCLCGAMAFNQLSIHIARAKLAWWITLTILVMMLLWGVFSGINPEIIKSLRKGSVTDLSFGQLVLISVLIQLPFLIWFRHLIWNYSSPKKMLLAGILNCMLFTMLFQPFTVIRKTRAEVIDHKLADIRVKGYPIPDLTTTIANNNQVDAEEYRMIGPVNIYNKKIGRSPWFVCPSNLLLHRNFWANEVKRNEVLNRAFINDGISALPTAITITGFSPSTISFDAEQQEKKSWTIMQTFHPNWELTEDEKQIPIQLSEDSFVGFEAAAGKHHYTLQYNHGIIPLAFAISTVTLLLSLIWLVRLTPARSSRA